MMLVVMEPDAAAAELGAVQALADEEGVSLEPLAGDGRIGYRLKGRVAPGVRERFAALAGVDAILDSGAAVAPRTNNLRVESIRPLLPPSILMEDLPLPPSGADLVRRTRGAITDILNLEDDRLLVVVGPCSVHDTEAALDYGRRLAKLSAELADDLLIVMRVYFEKPRTTVGWKGLINDPRLDESFAVNEGLRTARRLLLDLVAMDVPAGCEFLDPVLPQFFTDTVTWGAIGARTTESQIHRQLASGLSMPVGFKNGTGGGIQMAVDAVGAAAYPHHFIGVTDEGLSGIVSTRGNPDCHVILRGGSKGPNYDPETVALTLDLLAKARLAPRLMVDTSHGNSGKDYRRQPEVVRSVAEQMAAGQRGIVGVLMESFIEDGRQDDPVVYGQSITDSCMGWEMTVPVLHDLAAAVRARRGA